MAKGDGILAIVTIALAVLRWWMKKKGRRTRRFTIALALFAVGTLLFAWARRVEPHFVEVTHHDLRLTDEALRVAVLADLHAGRADRAMLEKAVTLTNAEQPDVILLAGDYISGYELTDERRDKLQGLNGLKAKRGVFAVLGNHDSEPYGEETPRRDAIAQVLESFGYRVLRNEARELGRDVWLIGVDEIQAGKNDAPNAFASVPPHAKRVAFAHDWHSLDAEERFDLAFAGHTHGGQICLPFTSVCAGPARNEPYVRGRHAWKRGGVLYVNRGIGLSKLPLRFACRPEVTVFELGPR